MEEEIVNFNFLYVKWFNNGSCKFKINKKTLEQGVKYVQS